EYVGGYQDWLRQGGSPRLLGVGEGRSAKAEPRAESPVVAEAPAQAAEKPAGEAPKKKLSYKLQRELEALPGQIEALEAEMEAVQQEISDPAFYQRPAEQTRAVLERFEQQQQELDRLLERWAELED
ncbi:ABC transporter ATP-binding protein, partial [Metapseudomonas otitidis]